MLQRYATPRLVCFSLLASVIAFTGCTQSQQLAPNQPQPDQLHDQPQPDQLKWGPQGNLYRMPEPTPEVRDPNKVYIPDLHLADSLTTPGESRFVVYSADHAQGQLLRTVFVNDEDSQDPALTIADVLDDQRLTTRKYVNDGHNGYVLREVIAHDRKRVTRFDPPLPLLQRIPFDWETHVVEGDVHVLKQTKRGLRPDQKGTYTFTITGPKPEFWISPAGEQMWCAESTQQLAFDFGLAKVNRATTRWYSTFDSSLLGERQQQQIKIFGSVRSSLDRMLVLDDRAPQQAAPTPQTE